MKTVDAFLAVLGRIAAGIEAQAQATARVADAAEKQVAATEAQTLSLDKLTVTVTHVKVAIQEKRMYP